MKIRTKLYGVLMIMTAIVVALGIYTFITSKNSLIRSVGMESAFQSEEIMKRIDFFIHEKIMVLWAVTRRKEVVESVARSNHELEKKDRIEEYLESLENKWIADSPELTPLQQKLLTNGLARGLKKEFTTFLEILHGYSEISLIFVTNKYGATIAQTDKTIHYRRNKDKWWQEAMHTGVHIGNLRYDKTTDSYGIPVSFRIVDDNDNFMGVLQAFINVKAVIRKTEIASKRYETSRIRLLTHDGKIIYRTRPHKFLENISDWPLFKKFQQMDSGFMISSSEDGRKRLYSYSRSKGQGHYHGFGWIIVSSQDTQEIFAPINILRGRIITFSLFTFLLGTLLIIIIFNFINRSVAKLIQGANQIGKGDLSYRIELETNDELGQLAHSLNDMSRNLQNITTSRDELKKEISERKKTEELLIKKTTEFERMNKLMIGRELKMAALKKEMNELRAKFNEGKDKDIL